MITTAKPSSNQPTETSSTIYSSRTESVCISLSKHLIPPLQRVYFLHPREAHLGAQAHHSPGGAPPPIRIRIHHGAPTVCMRHIRSVTDLRRYRRVHGPLSSLTDLVRGADPEVSAARFLHPSLSLSFSRALLPLGRRPLI